MADPRDYKLDIAGLTPTRPTAAGRPAGRPFVSVNFACCSVYLRIYRDAEGKSYQGRCPRCGKPVKIAVGPGGTTARSFVVR